MKFRSRRYVWTALATGALSLAAACALTLSAEASTDAADGSPHFYMTPAETAQLRANVLKRKLPWSTKAWARTRAVANEALGQEPQVPDPKRNYNERGTGDCGDGNDGWFDCLYSPGRNDGLRVLALAQAYVITRDSAYGNKARDYLVQWSRGYFPPSSEVGHAVAEPVGIALKAFMAYDLVRDRLTPGEQAQFKAWARRLSELGRQRVDFYMDEPWIPEAPYGNSGTWSRAMAVLGAGVVGGSYLQNTLQWNWSHRTPKGKDGSWLDLIDGAVETRQGRMTEERVRASIDYALYTWHGLALIADAARRVGFKPNLFTATTKSGKSLLQVSSYYEPYLTKKRSSPHDENAARPGIDFDGTLSGYRAASELVLRNYPASKVLRRTVNYGGAAVRGANYDPHIVGYNGLTGGLVAKSKP